MSISSKNCYFLSVGILNFQKILLSNTIHSWRLEIVETHGAKFQKKKHLRNPKFNSPFLLIMKLRSREVTGLTQVHSRECSFSTSDHTTSLPYLKSSSGYQIQTLVFSRAFLTQFKSLQFLLLPVHSVLPAITAARVVPETSTVSHL